MTRWNPEPPIVRLLRRIDTTNPDACWIWPGAKDTSGYGMVRDGKRNRSTHRLVYEHFVGPIPAGLQLDHLCRRRACCNWSHLELVPPRVNSQRSEPATRPTCKWGHLFDYHNGRQRVCRECRRRRWREWKARQV